MGTFCFRSSGFLLRSPQRTIFGRFFEICFFCDHIHTKKAISIVIIGTLVGLLQPDESASSAFVRIFSTGDMAKCLQKNQKYTDIHADSKGVH